MMDFKPNMKQTQNFQLEMLFYICLTILFIKFTCWVNHNHVKKEQAAMLLEID